MVWESFDVVRFDLGPLLQGQMRIAKLKSGGGGGGGWTYYFCFVRRHTWFLIISRKSILSLPNLVWVFIRLIACMGLLLVKMAT